MFISIEGPLERFYIYYKLLCIILLFIYIYLFMYFPFKLYHTKNYNTVLAQYRFIYAHYIRYLIMYRWDIFEKGFFANLARRSEHRYCSVSVIQIRFMVTLTLSELKRTLLRLIGTG